MLKTYYNLTKPGIIYGNVLTAIAGFLLAAHTDIDVWLLLATVAGAWLVIASGCIINNYFDRDIDIVMKRTHKRALVTGAVSVRNALVLAVVLGVLGFSILLYYVNTLTALIGLIGLVDYAFIYTYAKRKTVYATEIGAISGATAIAAGYTAVTGQFDTAALLLFLIMVFFQMPHFYAIAIYRRKEYKKARIPVLPLVKGVKVTKIRILIYMLAFTLAASLLSVYGYTGYIYRVAILLLCAGWIRLGVQGFRATDDDKWARSVFFYSLWVILGISILIPLGGLLP